MTNKTILQGRFVKTPEIENKGGFDMTEFTIAWSEKYKERETKCFLRCKAWQGLAKHICNYFAKGQECVVEGRLETEEWEKDGQKQSRTVCSVEKIHFCGSKSSSNDSAVPTTSNDGFMSIPECEKEELPFN